MGTEPTGSRYLAAGIAATLVGTLLLGAILLPLRPAGFGAAALAVLLGTLWILWLARRASADRERLERNVQSLEDTNRDLIEARAEVVRTARLASVGTLAAGIAHEIGNPLGAIMAYADVARSRARNGVADPEILGFIRSEAERIDRIVRSLLDYARPRDHAEAPEAPGAVIARVRDLMDAQGRLAGVEHRWDVDPTTPDVVMNSQRLEQVLVNLLLNALDAMETTPAKSLRVRAYGTRGEISDLPVRREDDPPGVNYLHRRRVSRDDGGRGVDPVFVAERVAVIEVTDGGPGIPEADLEQVFDPFFTTKEPGRGTGLGLSICARLVEGMGGRIEAENAPEGGARFIIRLPAVRDTGSTPRSEVP